MESNKPDAEATCEMKSKPQSYVIFDTETTGLPGPYGNPKITELCLLGVHRDDMFEDGVTVPRIVNKLQLCLNPQKQVSPGSSMLTGLFNDALDRQQPFNSEIVAVIRGFLQTQAQPTCLIAHNGDKFDFPLLAAQLEKVDETLPHDILCADSLLAFREIDPPDTPRSPAEVRAQTWEIAEVTPGKRQNSDDQSDIPKKPKKDFSKTQSLFENIKREKAARQLYKEEANGSVTGGRKSLEKAVSLSKTNEVDASSFRENFKSSIHTDSVCKVTPEVAKDLVNVLSPCSNRSQDTCVTLSRSDKVASETVNNPNSVQSTTMSRNTTKPQIHNRGRRTGSEASQHPRPSQLNTSSTCEVRTGLSNTPTASCESATKTQLDSQGSFMDEDLLMAVTQMEADNGLDHKSLKNNDSVHPQATRLPIKRRLDHEISTVVGASDREACQDRNGCDTKKSCICPTSSSDIRYTGPRISFGTETGLVSSSQTQNRGSVSSSCRLAPYRCHAAPLRSSGTQDTDAGSLSSSETQDPSIGSLSSSDTQNPSMGSLSSCVTQNPNTGALNSYETQDPNIGSLSSSDTQNPSMGSLSSSETQDPNIGALSSSDTQNPSMGSLSSYETQDPTIGPLSSSETQNPSIGSLSSSETQNLIIGSLSSSETQNPIIGSLSSSDTQNQSTGPSSSGTPYNDAVLIDSDTQNTQVLTNSQESVLSHPSREDSDADEHRSQSIIVGSDQPRLNSEATVIYNMVQNKKAISELSSQGSLPDGAFLEAVQNMEKQEEKARNKVFSVGSDSVKVTMVRAMDVKNNNSVRDDNHNRSVVEPKRNGAVSSNTSSSRSVAMKSVPRKSYRLQDVYIRCFGHPPQVAHTAEDDCIALLKIVKKFTPRFLDWVDEHCVPLNTIPPMY
ncbi:serine-rich adhesin for platelets-like [Haliotis cracherodii]|uniref:serine-rich adhesin for platelets-like n=1 Tax=Haliotis cracherodii TaxID=6455 RepID=UPI0039EC015A